MVKIEFDTDNDAFVGDAFESEVARILKAFARKIEHGVYVENWPVRDSNGSTIGRATIMRETEA